jgi:hypothetical protein
MLNVKCVLGRVCHARIIGLLPRRSVTDSETGVCPRARLTPPADTRREAFASLRARMVTHRRRPSNRRLWQAAVH